MLHMQIAVLWFLFYSRTFERPFSFLFCCIYFYLCSFDKRELKGEKNDFNTTNEKGYTTLL